MCGIVGCLGSLTAIPNIEIALQGSLSEISHRGPDASGVVVGNNFGLGHVRLSVIDVSSSANQPMMDSSGRYLIVYNGETYNFGEMKANLEEGGLSLNSRSDTEIVLEYFVKHGSNSVSTFNGMFAFCIVDTTEQKAWLVRDRLGIKPLYYLENEASIYFASEVSALTKLAPVDPTLNYSALSEWAYFGAEVGDKTLRNDVKKLLPGHMMEVDLNTGRASITAYWSPEVDIVKIDSDANVKRKIRSLLDQAVSRQLVSDVPLGVFLSGGIDSSTIVAIASQHSPRPINTFSVGFGFHAGINELPAAAKVAEHFKSNHTELIIEDYDLVWAIETLISRHGFPFADAANIPLLLLSKAVKEDVKVVLQGDGGDEIFGGYRRYQTLNFYQHLRKFSLGFRGIEKLMPDSGLMAQKLKRYLKILASKTDYELMAQLLTVETSSNNPLDIFANDARQAIAASQPFEAFRSCDSRFFEFDLTQKMLYTDTQIILPDIFLEKVDRATMASSIEVRVPFLDNDLVQYVMGLPSSSKINGIRKKALLIDAMRGTVPDFVLDAPKTGFSVPYGKWLIGPLRDYFEAQLAHLKMRDTDVVDFAQINRLMNEHVSYSKNHSFLLWKVLNLVVWLNSFGDKYEDFVCRG